MISRRQVVRAGMAGVAAGALLPSLGAPAIAANRGGTLKVGLTDDPLTFDPHLAGNLQGRGTTQAIHDTLFTIDDASEIYRWNATSSQFESIQLIATFGASDWESVSNQTLRQSGVAGLGPGFRRAWLRASVADACSRHRA